MDGSNNDNMFQSESYSDVLSLLTRQVINGKSVLIYNSTAPKNDIKNNPKNDIKNNPMNDIKNNPMNDIKNNQKNAINPAISCVKSQIARNVQPKVVRSKKMMFT